MQGIDQTGNCIRLAGSAVKSQNKFKYLSKNLNLKNIILKR